MSIAIPRAVVRPGLGYVRIRPRAIGAVSPTVKWGITLGCLGFAGLVLWSVSRSARGRNR